MAVFVFILALLLAIAGGGGLAAGYTLLPLEAGIVYATCGAFALSTAALVAALGALIVRIDANAAKILAARAPTPLATPLPKPPPFPARPGLHSRDWMASETAVASAPLPETAPAPEPAPLQARPPELAPPVAREPAPAPPRPDLPPLEKPAAAVAEGAEEEPVNENRAGRLPTFREVEANLAHPEPPAKIVGRYSASGAHYRIYSDGSIEAETDEGQFKFASMDEFKAFVAARKV